MAKKPSSSKKKFSSRTAKSSPAAGMEPKPSSETKTTNASKPAETKSSSLSPQPPTPKVEKSGDTKAPSSTSKPTGEPTSKPTSAESTPASSAARDPKPKGPDITAASAKEPPVGDAQPAATDKSLSATQAATKPAAAQGAAPAKPAEGTQPPKTTAPPQTQPAAVTNQSEPAKKTAATAAPPTQTKPGTAPPPASEPKPLQPAPKAAETPKIKTAAQAESAKPAQPEAKPAVSGQEPEAPTAEAKPAAPAKQEETTKTVPMPAQAESVHIEEPLPDETPEQYHTPTYRPELFIIHVSPEMAPVAKVGGLADVVFGLTGELSIRGNHTEVILPKYDNLRYDHIYELHEVYKDLWVPWYEGAIHCTIFFGFVHGRKCFFIEPHSGDNFFNRGSVYGFADDIMRFAFFSRAAIEFMWKAGKHPDIIHCHDWQTALVPVLLYEIYQKMGMSHPRACLTIHNFKHQGVTGMELLRATGLHDPDRYFDYNRLRDNHHPNALNLLKGGIVYSNFITTVSPHYAMETKDQGQGFGLEPTLHTHHMKYGGVLNGIDYNVWNPEVDHLLPAQYGVDNIENKYENKRALRHRLMLADNEKPIVAFIGRLDPQKGLDLVRHAIFKSLEQGAQFVLLGSSPDHAINADFWNLKHMLNDSPDCHLEIGYNEELSHLIYAGADIMLVPSQFEPCGLTQLISLRYGTIPVVRSVGGLADTVFDKDHSHRELHERNGYVFETYDQAGLDSALIRAISCYYQYPEHFRDLMRNAMRTDYSWNHPGQDYMNIYDFIRD
jgi:starch synthase